MTSRRGMRSAILAAAVTAFACRAPSHAPEESSASAAQPSHPASEMEIKFPDGEKISAEVADSPQSRELGLMFRTELGPNKGMLFLFPREEELEFWMKNTFMDLDMVFIGSDKRITVVRRDVPRSRVDTPENRVARRSGSGRYVLELPAGAARRHGLKPGDRLEFGP